MICSLIKRLIDWDGLGLECAGIASNGTECLAMVEQLQPDIVITDIRMPGLSGLELIEKCVQLNSRARFIIVSGYGQFDYAQQAIRYGVSDFLIKPIQKDELNDSLRRLVRVISGGDVEEKAKATAPDQRHSLLMSLLFGDFAAQQYADVTALNRAYGYRFGEGDFLPVTVCLDAKAEARSHSQTILDSIRKILREEMGARCVDYAMITRDQAVHALFQFPPEAMDGLQVALQYAFDRMLIAISPYNLYHVTMGTGGISGIGGMQDAFTRAVCAVKARLQLGLDRLHDGSALDLQLADVSRIAVKAPNAELESALQTMDTEAFADFFLGEYRRQMPDMKRFPYSLAPFAKAYVAAFCRDVRAKYSETLLPQARETALLVQVDDCLTSGEIEECLAGFARSVSGEMQSARPDIKIIQQVKAYIYENYQQRITLEDAAGEVFLSPAYLGILFKRETGENFSDYLITVKMEKAKELLRDVRLNVNQISETIGYKDTHHFIKLFKRAVGITPAQYRKFLCEGELGGAK